MGALGLVVGGAGAIGRHIVKSARAAGDRVVVLDRASMDLDDREVMVDDDEVTFDQGDAKSVVAALAQVDRIIQLTPIDYLVCAASISRRGDFIGASIDTIDEMLRVNVRGVAQVCQEVARRMTGPRGGRIVVITSIAATQAWANEPFYCVTKAAQAALVQAMAVELAGLGIVVNAVAPGPVDVVSRGMVATRDDDSVGAQLIDRTPLRRFVSALEVAEAVMFLCRSSGVTGQTLYVDAGFLAAGLTPR